MLNRSSIRFAVAAFALIGAIAATSPASANAGHNNVAGPDVTDAGTVRGIPNRDASNCYTEPSGFHTSIHWDSACRDAQRADRMRNENSGSATSKYAEPSGFHYNVRSR